MNNGPTGAMPQDFWQNIGATATIVVNILLEAGQLIYNGLVVIGRIFAALAR